MVNMTVYKPQESTSSAAMVMRASGRANKLRTDIFIQVPRRGLFGPVKPASTQDRLNDQIEVVVNMRRKEQGL